MQNFVGRIIILDLLGQTFSQAFLREKHEGKKMKLASPQVKIVTSKAIKEMREKTKFMHKIIYAN